MEQIDSIGNINDSNIPKIKSPESMGSEHTCQRYVQGMCHFPFFSPTLAYNPHSNTIYLGLELPRPFFHDHIYLLMFFIHFQLQIMTSQSLTKQTPRIFQISMQYSMRVLKQTQLSNACFLSSQKRKTAYIIPT